MAWISAYIYLYLVLFRVPNITLQNIYLLYHVNRYTELPLLAPLWVCVVLCIEPQAFTLSYISQLSFKVLKQVLAKSLSCPEWAQICNPAASAISAGYNPNILLCLFCSIFSLSQFHSKILLSLQIITSGGEDTQKLKSSYTSGENINCYSPFGNSLAIPQNATQS